jgi:adenylate kinase family enzyme
LTAYKESTIPVIDLYERFGKVKKIDTNRDELEAYNDTRKAMLPQISCMIGPKASGKTTLGNALCERTNMKLVNFNTFCTENKLDGEDDETVTAALIKQMS